MRITHWTFLLVLLAVTAPVVAAGAPSPDGLSLDEAIRIGLKHNPDLAAARADTEAAGAVAREAEAGRWPRLATEAGWRRTDNQVIAFGDKLTAAEFTAADFALDSLNHPDPVSHALAAVSLQIPLFTSGRIVAGIAAARGGAAASRAQQRAAEADLVTSITEAYFGVALAGAAVGVAETALDNARSHETSAAARHQAGSALKSDLLRAQVARLERERDLQRRRADLEIARSRLGRVLGDPAEGLRELVTPLQSPGDDLGEPERWLDAAVGSRPEVEAARRGAEAAAAAARQARAERGPEAFGTARYERNASAFDGGEGSFLLGIGVRWSAFDRGRSARIDAAEARATSAAARRRAAEDGVRFEAEAAYRDALVADRSLDSARQGASAAEEARRITKERYDAGLLPLTDLLDTETALVRARLAALAALYESVVGRVRLQRTAGLLEVPR
jgi:outer membrane protein